MTQTQHAWNRYLELLKYHGPLHGIRRAFDQFTQIDMYDYCHSTNTRHILSGEAFTSSLKEIDAAAAMYYGPVYTAAVKKPLKFLAKNYPIIGASSTCFLDLGCGRGKALHVARSTIQHSSLIGVDIHRGLLLDAAQNLSVDFIEGTSNCKSREFLIDLPKIKLICNNVNEVDYGSLLSPYDVVVVFNKNSFDKKTTLNTLGAIRSGTPGQRVFYVYSNPVFSDYFDHAECLFEMTGWHKNWNTRIFSIT